MSRVGKVPITIPAGVTVTVESTNLIVNGPKGTQSQILPPEIGVRQDGDKLLVEKKTETTSALARQGLIRALIANMVTGVSGGFSKKLEINGVGYRVALAGNELKFSLGYSHPVNYKLPEGTTAAVEQNTITISGVDKQKVGQVAAEIRALRKPEPYKGKGIKYADEWLIRKSGKSGKEKTGA